jgi:hypothetical protein
MKLSILILSITPCWFAKAYYVNCLLCDGEPILYPYNTVPLRDPVTGTIVPYYCINLIPYPTEDCDYFKSYAEPYCGCPQQAPFVSPVFFNDDSADSTSLGVIIGSIVAVLVAIFGGVGVWRCCTVNNEGNCCNVFIGHRTR